MADSQPQQSKLTYEEIPADPTKEEKTLEIQPGTEETDLNESSSTILKSSTGSNLGYRTALKSCFKVTLYDLKKDSHGGAQNVSVKDAFEQMTTSTLNLSLLKKCGIAPFRVFSASLYHPPISPQQILTEFGAPPSMQPENLVIHYRASIQPDDTRPLRLYVYADHPIIISADNVVILKKYPEKQGEWATPFITSWIKPVKGKAWQLDILLGLDTSASFIHCILVEQQGIAYHQTPDGIPLLPSLRTIGDVPMAQGDALVSLPPVDNSFGGVFRATPLN